MEIFNSINELLKNINNTGYICDKYIATTLYLAYHLQKPLLILGPPGTGKTEIALTMAKLLNSECIRLQCYEGISVNEAVYDFDYKKQLLYIEMVRNQKDAINIKDEIYSEQFLSPRPLLKSIMSDKKEVLLIDEIDKSDEEFEAYLLEILSAFQISIPEIGTFKSKNIPFVILTSNDNRQLSDALLRRCIMLYIDFPTLERELQIVETKVPQIGELLATQLVQFVNKLRKEDVKKIPSISETLDWASAMVKLNETKLTSELVKDTLNLILKNKQDLDNIFSKIDSMVKGLSDKPIKVEKINIINKIDEEKSVSNEDWNF